MARRQSPSDQGVAPGRLLREFVRALVATFDIGRTTDLGMFFIAMDKVREVTVGGEAAAPNMRDREASLPSGTE